MFGIITLNLMIFKCRDVLNVECVMIEFRLRTILTFSGGKYEQEQEEEKKRGTHASK